METWPELQEAVTEVLNSLSPGSPMVTADLGCSSGPNTLLVVSEVMSTIRAYLRETADNSRAMEVQFFLNDLPGNDFNLIFGSLDEQFHSLVTMEEKTVSPCYIAGLPGSMYTRILPCQSVHLFHSSHCLIWRSKVPEGLSNGTHVNGYNIYIGKTTPQVVVKLFREQFEKDFELFLTLRNEELVSGGRMVLTFAGRKRGEMPMHGGVARVWEVLSEALEYLVHRGRVEKKKLSSFNMPYYAPSLDEVTQLIKKQNDLFDLEDIRLFESNWDAHDDSDGDVVLDCSSSAANIAKIIRAGIEPLIINHFGEDILDELFRVYASILAKNLEKGKAMCPVIVVTLKKSKN
ncbi:Anthranilate O-methyltransferase 2 [Dichanthelium oligosanthes]|uniref:Anthranilate O-methyltransferase 2 n=1 Tax=Dichanthelium oligosanthes TaxID=888268 RepID=A0A1E5UTA4_9POAL|nr:Anthranilate O-methyltransferase 2 [Dichanthelium oligosanthes]